MSQIDDQPPTAPPADSAEVARMHRQTRICLWIIVIGLVNFLAFVIGYSYLYGEAVNGWVEDWAGHYRYFLQSDREVSQGEFIYSGVHSISVWITVGAVMLAMLTLAKERIASSMRVTILRGRTLITVLATIITITIVLLSVVHTLRFVQKLHHPTAPAPATQPNDTLR